MSHKVTVNDPTVPKGTVIGIKGLGAFENGKSTNVSDEDEDAFRAINGVVVSTTDKKGVTSVSREPGPSLTDAVKSMHGVELSSASNKGKGDDK